MLTLHKLMPSGIYAVKFAVVTTENSPTQKEKQDEVIILSPVVKGTEERAIHDELLFEVSFAMSACCL